MALARRYEPHVALVDLFLGDGVRRRGVRAAARGLAGHARAADLGRGAHLAERRPRRRRVAASSPRTGPRGDVARAVRMVGLGMTVFEPQRPRRRRGCSPSASARCSTSSPTGATNPEIADALFLSPHTVKEHTSALYRKLKVRNRAEAVQRAQRLGLLS